MKWIIWPITAFLFCTNLWASEQSNLLSIEKMQLSYLDGIGEVELSKLHFKSKAFEFQGVDKKYDLQKEGAVFQLENAENRFLLGPYASQSLDNLGMIDLKDFSFFYREGSRLAFHTYHLHVEIGDGIQQVSKMQWDCQSDSHQDFWARICLRNLKASIRVIQLAKQSEKTIKSFTDFLMQEQNLFYQEDHELSKAPKKIENIMIQIQSGQAMIQLQARYLFNWTLKVEGVTSVNQENDRIVFRLDRAKVGFISVRSKVLELIENAGLKNVQRIGNEIHILL